jgi:hypothetical protein
MLIIHHLMQELYLDQQRKKVLHQILMVGSRLILTHQNCLILDKEGKVLRQRRQSISHQNLPHNMIPYIEGDPRFTHVKRDTRSLVYAWAQKEFKKELYRRSYLQAWVEENMLSKVIYEELTNFLGKEKISNSGRSWQI